MLRFYFHQIANCWYYGNNAGDEGSENSYTSEETSVSSNDELSLLFNSFSISPFSFFVRSTNIYYNLVQLHFMQP